MGGRQHTQHGRHGRTVARRAALLCALGTLLGALILCGRMGAGTEAGPGPVSGTGEAAHTAAAFRHAGHAAYVCPGDLPGCSPFAHATPGVLPVPPPAVLPVAGEPPPAAAADPDGRIRPPRALARAPDLHVLQVLRT
ncbi:hypothetical protein [Streptomyces sp. NPDC090022]|uniref:hypothetical protein n=1 Tax=Streptomyces sp. NPDC090022 TaxID=3365920 RepID=UPI0037F57B64